MSTSSSSARAGIAWSDVIARILGTLAARLRHDRGRYGVAAICLGVGQAPAVVLENVQ